MQYTGISFTKESIRRYVGHMAQIAPVKSYVFTEGREKGCHAYDVSTGAGLRFTVLADRCLDLYTMDYAGKGVAYITKSGVAASQYFDPHGYEWLRSFGGGVLTTCGLMQAGPPEKVGIWDMGLHGRISNTPAFDVCCQSSWKGNEYETVIKGSMREAVLYEENLVLHRTISSVAGKNVVNITDIVENQGVQVTPYMLIYHMNFGYPLISEDTRLTIPSSSVKARDEASECHIENWMKIPPPDANEGTALFFHDMQCDENGKVRLELYNVRMKYGVYIEYNKLQLPCFSQWKNISPQDYVIGLEPGTCFPTGRKENQLNDILKYLEPNQMAQIELEIGIMEA